MNSLFITLTLIFTNLAFAQSTIERGVNFFRRQSNFIPMNAPIAGLQHDSRSGYADSPQYFLGKPEAIFLRGGQPEGTAIGLDLTHIANSGLTFYGKVSFAKYDANYSYHHKEEFQDIYSGELTLESCLRENGKDVFDQFKSLEEVLKYSREANEMPRFTSCLLTSPSMVANFTTPMGTLASPIIENVKIYLFTDHVQIFADIKGHPQTQAMAATKPDKVANGVLKYHSPFLYYYPTHDSSEELLQVRKETLTVLQTALTTLQGEIGDKQLPKTVAYILDNKAALNDSLRKLSQARVISPFQLINFSVSVKNAFHILDQAVGLASDKRVQMRNLIQMNSK